MGSSLLLCMRENMRQISLCEPFSALLHILIWLFQLPKPTPQEEETEEERQFRDLFRRIAGEVGRSSLGLLRPPPLR